jgi:hypothetical protein
MYAFIVKDLWEKYGVTNNVGAFLANVGTPCVVESYNDAQEFNGVKGHFVEVSHGCAIKYDASLTYCLSRFLQNVSDEFGMLSIHS